MKFLIQKNMANDWQDKLLHCVKYYPHQLAHLKPYTTQLTSDDPIEGDQYIPIGSSVLLDIGIELGWKGIFFDPDKFTMSACLTNRDDMLNMGLILSVRDAEKHLCKIGNTGDAWVFVRPDEDNKKFSGHVAQAKNFADWFVDAMSVGKSSGSYYIDPDMLVLISQPTIILAEYRYFIVEGRVISGSMYMEDRQFQCERVTDATRLKDAQKFANKWLPSKTCTMDLALTPDGTKVIEFNCINSSGFYDCDIDDVLHAIDWIYKGE